MPSLTLSNYEPLTLGTKVRMTVWRNLAQLPYLTSYCDRGRYCYIYCGNRGSIARKSMQSYSALSERERRSRRSQVLERAGRKENRAELVLEPGLTLWGFSVPSATMRKIDSVSAGWFNIGVASR
jgi:hypothetical protein